MSFIDEWFPTIESLGNTLKSIAPRINISDDECHQWPKQIIPRKIYQTWFNNSFSGPLMREAVHSWIHLNPEYHYYFFNDQDCKEWISKYCGPRYLNAYLSINEVYGAARSDYFRYLILWRWGGIYVDIDTKLKDPLRDWIYPNDHFITGSGNNVPNQFMLIAKQNHTVYRKAAIVLTEKIEKRTPFTQDVITQTGPAHLTNIYNQIITQRMTQDSNDMEDVIVRKIPQKSVHMNVGGHIIFKLRWAQITNEMSKMKMYYARINTSENPFYVNATAQ